MCSVMHSPVWKADKKHKVFDNLLNRNVTVNKKNKIWYTDYAFGYISIPNAYFTSFNSSLSGKSYGKGFSSSI